jgi:dethiobiotin synthetase
MKPQGLFVTGTDTGVGKTVVTAALLAMLRYEGLDAVPMKPVQTGCRRGAGGRLEPPDLDAALRRAGLPRGSEAERRYMCPYRFASPCSPHLAAQREGATISLARIARCFRALHRRHGFVVVEGAGGVLAPIGARRTMADVMERLRLPVVLVARPGLGTINHTLLSLRELRRRGILVLGVIFNCSRPSRRGYIERDNEETICRLGHVRILGRVPCLGPRERT